MGWRIWPTKRGWTEAHYVGAPGTAPICGWLTDQTAFGRSGSQPTVADSSHCQACERALVAR